MQSPSQLTPDQIDELLARVLLVFAKRGRELRQLREIQHSESSALPTDDRTATAANAEQQLQVRRLPARERELDK